MELIEQKKEFIENKNRIISGLVDQLPKIIGETDYSPVLVGITILENELEKYITSFLIESPTAKDELFETGALSTFSSKILLARRLGLVNNELQNVLNTMRKIRNMANSSADKSLEQINLNKLMKNLYIKYKDNQNLKEIEKKIKLNENYFRVRLNNETKANFILILYFLIYTLEAGKFLAHTKGYKAKLVLSFP